MAGGRNHKCFCQVASLRLTGRVCCTHGAGTAETDFAPQLRDLSDTMQVVSFDPRGYGQSRPPRRDFPVDFYQQDADDAAALMEALGHKEYNVVGWSDGSIAAVLLAAKQKAAVGKLVIFGGNAFFTKDDIDAYEATRDIETSWSKRMKATHVPVYAATRPRLCACLVHMHIHTTGARLRVSACSCACTCACTRCSARTP